MQFCHTCKTDVSPIAAMGANMRPERVCPGCAGVLPEPVRAAPVAAPQAVAPAMAPPVSRPAAPVSLAKQVQARRRELRAEIRRLQRELAQLDRLFVRRAKPATVTRIRGAS